MRHSKRILLPSGERKMLKTLSIPQVTLKSLPDDVLRLVSMGRYTLYQASSPSHPEIAYALRVSAKEIFALAGDGSPLECKDFSDIQVTGKVEIEDVPAPFVLSNFSFT
jgi:hypothetical protein